MLNTRTEAGDPCRDFLEVLISRKRGPNLALRDENGDRMVFARGDRKVDHTLHTQFTPYAAQILRLVEVDFVGYHSSTELLVEGVLQIPACLRFLHKFPNPWLFILELPNDLTDKQILSSIPLLIFGWSLPGYYESAPGRKANFEDVLSGYGS